MGPPMGAGPSPYGRAAANGPPAAAGYGGGPPGGGYGGPGPTQYGGAPPAGVQVVPMSTQQFRRQFADSLLTVILHQWAEVEFASSVSMYGGSLCTTMHASSSGMCATVSAPQLACMQTALARTQHTHKYTCGEAVSLILCCRAWPYGRTTRGVWRPSCRWRLPTARWWWLAAARWRLWAAAAAARGLERRRWVTVRRFCSASAALSCSGWLVQAYWGHQL